MECQAWVAVLKLEGVMGRDGGWRGVVVCDRLMAGGYGHRVWTLLAVLSGWS